MRLYYHKTDGGAEYLTDKGTKNPDGSDEGVFKGARVIVRIDGDIRKDAEVTLVDDPAAPELAEALRAVVGWADMFRDSLAYESGRKHIDAARAALEKASTP